MFIKRVLQFVFLNLIALNSHAEVPALVLEAWQPQGLPKMVCKVFDDHVDFVLETASSNRSWSSKVSYDALVPSPEVVLKKAKEIDQGLAETLQYPQASYRRYTFRLPESSSVFGLIRDIDPKRVVTTAGSAPLMSFIDRNCYAGFDLWNQISNPLRTKAYDQIKKTLKDLHKRAPNSTQLFQLKTPKMREGFPIEKIVGIEIGKEGPADLVVATHHGNEHGSTEVLMALAESFVIKPIHGRRIFLIPVLNVPGYVRNLRLEYGVDPNRTYPGPCGSTAASFSLESTKALGRFLQKKKIVTAIALHNSGNTVSYPWANVKNTPTGVAHEFSRMARVATAVNGFKSGTSADVVYETLGNFEDFAFWRFGIWSFLFEMGTPNWEQEIPDMIAKNVDAVRSLLEAAPSQRAIEHDWTGTCQEASFQTAYDLTGKRFLRSH